MNTFNHISHHYSSELPNDICKIFNDDVIRKDIINLYIILVIETDIKNSSFYNQHIVNLYNEWLINLKNNNLAEYNKYIRNTFIEKFYLMESKETDFYKLFFAVQTYFSIIVKLLFTKSLKQIKNDNNNIMDKISWSELSSLFLNSDPCFNEASDGLFDVDYYVWFISVEIRHTNTIQKIAENILSKLNSLYIYDTLSYATTLKEQLVNLYSFLLPIGELGKCVTVTGEDFTKALDHEIGLSSTNNKLKFESAKKISSNLIGFTKDSILLLITKSSYILTIYYRTSHLKLKEPLMFKIYPSVSNLFKDFNNDNELKESKVTLETYVGDFVIPLSGSFYMDAKLFRYMSMYLENKKGFNAFWNDLCKKFVHLNLNKYDINRLYESLMLLRTPIQYDFWSVYIKNKITPLLILL